MVYFNLGAKQALFCVFSTLKKRIMSRSEDVLERKVIHPGKPFIKVGEEHARAYIIQNGEISAYVMDGDRKIEVTRYGPGRIIGEICLMSDEPMTMNYEALTDTTVVTLTRQEFQKKISKVDKNVATILEHVMNKLNLQYADDLSKAQKNANIDAQAAALVKNLISGVASDERKDEYQRAILPHLNAMLQEIKALKIKEMKNKESGGEE